MSSDQSETAVDPAAFVVVRTPAFFVALATDSQDANAARDPTEAETLEMTRRTEDQIRSQIAEDHPTGLVDFRLSLVRSETGTVRPDERFRLYHEYECAATFAAAAVAAAEDHHPPKQDELLALIMRCADIDYVKSLREMDGTPYAAVTMMSIQMVGMDEAAVEAAEEKIAARKKIDEETAEQKTDEQATKKKVKEEVTKKVQKKTAKKKKTKKEATKKEANEEAAKKDSDDEKAAATEAKPNANEETGDEVKVAEEKAIEEAATKAKQEVAPKKKKKKKSKKEKQRTKEGSLSPSSDRSIATNSSEESSVHSVTDAKEKIDLSPSSNESIATNSSEETSVHSITDAKEKIEDETKVVEEKPTEEAITEAKEEVAPKKKKKKKSKKEKKRTKEGHLSPGSDRSIATNSSEETSVHRVEDATEKTGEAEIAEEKVIEETATKANPEVAPKKKKKKSRKKKKQAKEGSLSPSSDRSIATDSSEERSIVTNSSEETSGHRVEDIIEKNGDKAIVAEEKVVKEAATETKQEVAPKKKNKKSKKEKKPAKEQSVSPSSNRVITNDPSDETSGNRFKTGMVYTAFKLDCCESNPPEEEYEKLRLKTQDYFTERLEEQFGSQLSEVQLSIHRKEFGSAKPDKHYNVYVEWDIETLCKPDPTSTTATADRQERVVADGVADTEANPENLTRFLVQGTDLMDYMLKAVQPIRKSAFANVTMGFIGGKLPTESMF